MGDVPRMQRVDLLSVINHERAVTVDVQGRPHDRSSVGEGHRHQRSHRGAHLPVCRLRRLPLRRRPAQLIDPNGQPLQHRDRERLPIEPILANTQRERQRGRGGDRKISATLVDIEADPDDDQRFRQRQVLAQDAAHLARAGVDRTLRCASCVPRRIQPGHQEVIGPFELWAESGHRRDRLCDRQPGREGHPPRDVYRSGQDRREGQPQPGRRLPAAIQPPPAGGLRLGEHDGIRAGQLDGPGVGRREAFVDLDHGIPSCGWAERRCETRGVHGHRHGDKAIVRSMSNDGFATAAEANAPDLSTTAGKLADLKRRVAEVANAGSTVAVEKQHAKGKKTARERIELLLDEGTFIEMDKYARHRSSQFGQDKHRPYGDGVVTGYGQIDGRQVAVFAQDFTVFGGSLGEVFGEKIVKVMDWAAKIGCPVIGLNDSGGARIQEGVVSLGLYGEIFFRNVRNSGVVPQISVIMGPCAGGAVYSPAITDFTVMVDKTSHMFITGPDVIKTVTGEEVAFEDLGGARAHNTKSGVAHYMGTDEDDAIEYVKALLSYLPSNNMEEPPAFDVDSDLTVTDEDRWLDTCIPDSPNQPYDMHQVIEHVVDDGEFLEVHALFAPNIVVGFARVDGQSVGIVANQPMQFAGCLDIEASEKAARFVRTCDAFNVPILTFVDVPGFLPGTDQEWNGIIRRGAKLIYAYAEATVPKITVITRKAYGGAYDVMGSKHLGADINLAWPTAQIAVMGAQGAVNILYRKELQKAVEEGRDVEAARADFIKLYEETLANPYIAAERGYIDTVITPSNTRMNVTRALRALKTKRESLPPKKHGNIPL